jgi:predicted DNA-binding ribbon-helix-helix protein
MKSKIAKRGVVVAGHKTTVSLEPEFWNGLREIAGEREMTLWGLVTAIDSERQDGINLSSAIRVFVLDFYRDQLSAERKVINRPVGSVPGRVRNSGWCPRH